MKSLLPKLLIALAAFLIALGLWETGVLRTWEGALFDMRSRLMAKPSPQADRIRIIYLDQESLNWGQEENGLSWPWPREVYTPILAFLRRAEAKAVFFDVLFTEPSAYGVEDDRALGESIAATPGFVGALQLSTDTSKGVTRWPESWSASEMPDGWREVVPKGAFEAEKITATLPIPDVGQNAGLIADVSGHPGLDGIYRESPLLSLFDHHLIPSPGLAMYMEEWDVAARDFIYTGSSLRVNSEKAFPLGKRAMGILRFRKGLAPYPVYSAASVIRSELQILGGEQPQLDPAVFKNALVFFGFSAPGLKDLRPLPTHPSAPGVLVHATLCDNLLSGDLMRRVPVGVVRLALLVLVLVSVLGVTSIRSVSGAVTVAVVALLLPILLSLVLFFGGWWFPLVPVELAVNLGVFGALGYQFATEGRQKAFIKKAFRHYLSPEVIETLVAYPERLQLGGVRRELSFFFCDVKGFSSIAESMDPTDLTVLLNTFLSRMTSEILNQGGTVDKYIGDAIVAFWNAPLDQEDHALRAARAALRCQEELERLRPEFLQQFGAEIHLRIGLNTGPAVVGNMGSKERFDYTVLGDAVNLASRLEGVNKKFGTSILMAEATWVALGAAMPGRRVACVKVVGREAPVAVYELFGAAAAGCPEDAGRYAEALEALASGEASRALALFEGLEDRDPAARAHADRLRQAGGEPWDGVWSLVEK